MTRAAMNLRSQVLSGLIWSGGARFASQLMTWGITLVVIRLLSPSDYGLLAMATVFINFLALLAEAGLGLALVQAGRVDEATLRRIFGAVIAIDCALFIVQFAASPAIAHFFSEQRLVLIVRVLALQFLLGIFAVVPTALLSRNLDFKRQSVVEVVSAVTGSVATLFMALAGYGVWALITGNLGSVVVRSIGINIVAPFLKRPDFSFRELRGAMAYGGRVTAARLLWFVYSQADTIIVGKLLGKELLGYYSVSMHLASLPVQRIASILNQVGFAAFAKIQHDPKQAGLYVLKGVRVLSFVAFPVLWGMSSIAPELVTVVLGPKWDLAILPLQVLTLVVVLRVVNVVLSTAVDGLGRADVTLFNIVVANAVMLPAFAVGSVWGLMGLTLVWGFVSPIVTLITWIRVVRVVMLRIQDIVSAMLPSAFCAGGMYGVVFLARRYVTHGQQGIIDLSILIAGGVASYSLLSVTLNGKGCKETVDLRKR